MLKILVILSMSLICCYCLEYNEVSLLESRAKKKRNSAKLLALILLFVFSKLAIFKTASVFFMMMIFQKLFSLGGLIFKYFMKMKPEKPAPLYGVPPTPSYDTVGYSYGPPEQESIHEGYPGKDISSSFDWILNKNVK